MKMITGQFVFKDLEPYPTVILRVGIRDAILQQPTDDSAPHRYSTDSKDRIYAILGIVEDGPKIKPDYSKSDSEVFRDAAFRVIVLRKNLSILSQVFHACGTVHLPETWTTWVPRWHFPILTTLIDLCPSFCASGSSLWTPPTEEGFSGKLVVEGISMASVQSVGMKTGGVVAVERVIGSTVIKIWEAFELTLQSEHATQKFGSSFLRTFVWTIFCGIPDEDNSKVGAQCWRDSQVYGDFGAFWVEYVSRICAYSPCSHTDTATWMGIRTTLAESAAIQFRLAKATTGSASEREEVAVTWKERVRTEPDSASSYGHIRKILLEKMRDKHDEDTAVRVAEELALYHVGTEWHKADQMWAQSGFNRRFFVLSDGLIGMGPMTMEADDVVVILRGGPVPYVLRPFGDEYMFVGECYVYGAMYGEYFGDNVEMSSFTIV